MANFTLDPTSYIQYTGSYSYTDIGSAIRVSGSIKLSKASGAYVEANPKLMLYLVPNDSFFKNGQGTITDITGAKMQKWISDRGGKSSLFDLGNGSVSISGKSASFTVDLAKGDSDKTVTMYIGAGIQSTFMWNDWAAEKSFSVSVPSAYKSPSGLSISSSEVTSTSFKISASWTAGVGSDGRAYVTANGQEKLIDNDPVVFTGLTPNVKYPVSARLADDVNPNASYDTASTTVLTNIVDPSSWSSITSTSTTITASAKSSNGGNFKYQYRIQKNGTWSSWQDSGTFSGLTSNTYYPLETRCVNTDNSSTTGSLAGSTWTKIATPTISASSTTTTITVSAGANGNASLSYRYKIDSGSWQTSNVFTVNPNTYHTVYVKVVNESNTADSESDAASAEIWSHPVINSPSASLRSGSEHNTIDVSTSAQVSSSYDQFAYRIDNGSWSGWTTSTSYAFGSLGGYTNHTLGVKMKNTSSGYESAEKTTTLRTWYNPVTGLTINLVKNWFWYLETNCSYNYQGGIGNISKYEFDIGGQGYQDKGTSNFHSRGSATPGKAGNLSYNTSYTCKVRITDNHGRTYTASATFKTLDERPLYVNGTLREVKVIKPDNSVVYVTPNLLTVVNSDGSTVNMNKIINNDSRTNFS